MDDFTRLSVAYVIIAAIVLVAVPTGILYLRKRGREKLRRRGIKRYGH